MCFRINQVIFLLLVTIFLVSCESVVFLNLKKIENGYGTYYAPRSYNDSGVTTDESDGIVSSSSHYTGEWKDYKMHGQGTFKRFHLTHCYEYEGAFKDDKMHGQGTFTWCTGRWKGETSLIEWVHGLVTGGQGPLVHYVGETKEGKYHGQGTFTFIGLANYVGEFKEGKYHGQGTYTWSKGAKYVGEWKDGARHGQGIFYFIDGRIWEGQWRNGNLFNGKKYTVQEKRAQEQLEKKREEAILR